jgi:hypothetical protein
MDKKFKKSLELELFENSLIESYKKARADAKKHGLGFILVVKNQTSLTYMSYDDVMCLKKTKYNKNNLQS